MTMHEVPTVTFFKLEKSGKFIVVQLKDAAGATKTIVRAGDYGTHANALMKLNAELRGVDVMVFMLGGGTITRSMEKRAIWIYDRSTKYGSEPNRELTTQLIQTECPDFTIQQGEPSL